jgi:hypothetical protein
MTKFKNADNNVFNRRDKIRLEPIFKNSKKDFNELLGKKHKLEVRLQLNLENAKKSQPDYKFSDCLRLNTNTKLKKK